MAEYIYKTTPRLIAEQATIHMDDGEIIHNSVAGYVFAYKPYWSADHNKKLEARYVLPAKRAFDKRFLDVPRYGVIIDKKAKGPAVGDRVFLSMRSVALSDYALDRIGVIINLDDSNDDNRTLPQLLDPAHYGILNIPLTRYIGKIVLHDYGFGTSIGPEFVDPAEWKAKLNPELRTLFERLERATQGIGGD